MAVGVFHQPSCEDACMRQLLDVRNKAAEIKKAMKGRDGMNEEEEEELLQASCLHRW